MQNRNTFPFPFRVPSLGFSKNMACLSTDHRRTIVRLVFAGSTIPDQGRQGAQADTLGRLVLHVRTATQLIRGTGVPSHY